MGHPSNELFPARQKSTVRRLTIPASLFALVAVTARATWFVWLPNYRPALHAHEQYGIDVSHHQGRINWTRVKRDGISFAYIKASEGGRQVDGSFSENWRYAGHAGMRRGAYHFFTLCASGDEQAARFPDTIHGGAELAPAVDVELLGNCTKRPSRASVRRALRTFVQKVEVRTGQRVNLYVGDDFEARCGVRSELQRPLWRLRFLRRPASNNWTIWQVMGFAHVDGIHGDVDLDVGRLNMR